MEKLLEFLYQLFVCRSLGFPPNWFEIARPHSKTAIEVKPTDLFYIDAYLRENSCFWQREREENLIIWLDLATCAFYL